MKSLTWIIAITFVIALLTNSAQARRSRGSTTPVVVVETKDQNVVSQP